MSLILLVLVSVELLIHYQFLLSEMSLMLLVKVSVELVDDPLSVSPIEMSLMLLVLVSVELVIHYQFLLSEMSLMLLVLVSVELLIHYQFLLSEMSLMLLVLVSVELVIHYQFLLSEMSLMLLVLVSVELVSESQSVVTSVPHAEGQRKDLVSKNHLSCSIASSPLALASDVVTTQAALCNGESGRLLVTSLPDPIVATSTTTTTTTANSTSRSGVAGPSTTSTAVATAVTSQSVIRTRPCVSEHLGSIPSLLSPGSLLPTNLHTRGLPHNRQQQHYHHQQQHKSQQQHQYSSQQQHQHSSHCCDSATCARQLKHSPSLKSSEAHSKSPHHHHSPISLGGPSSSSPGYLQTQLHQASPESHSNRHTLSAKTHLSLNKTRDLPKLQTSAHFLSDNHLPGSDYPAWISAYPPNGRLNPHGYHSSSSFNVPEFTTGQQCPIGGAHSVTATIVSPVTNTALFSNPLHPQHRNLQHSASCSSLHTCSHLSSKAHTQLTHHDHQRSSSNSSRPESPLVYVSKRPCRSTPGLTSASTTNEVSGSDVSGHVTPLGLPKVLTCHRGVSGAEGKEYSETETKEQIRRQNPSPGHSHNLGRHNKDKDKERQKEKEAEKNRERQKVSASVSLGVTPADFSKPKPGWLSTPSSLYDPLLSLHHPTPLTPSPVIHPLGPYPSPSTALTSPLFPLPLVPPPPPPSLLGSISSPTLPTAMFAPPIHPAPTLSSHQTAPGQFSADSLLRNQDFLHQDLNNRLLAQRDPSSVGLSGSPFLRAETHQHQHQHLHNHMHQHTYGGVSAAAPLVPPTPSLIVPNYNAAAFTSLLPPGPAGTSLASSLQGAFQPKNVMVPGQMLVPFRDREKAVPAPGLTPPQKKQGKWCSVHVRVAWEIYHRQQKKLQRDPDGTSSSTLTPSALKPGSEPKPLDPLLRPPSGLMLPGSAVIRPPESSLLAPVTRSLPEGIAHPSSSFLSPAANLGLASFPRPSPYAMPSLLNPLGFSGLGGNMFASVHDMVGLPLSSSLNSPSSHEWNRLHHTPSTFPSWPRSESDKERERELRKEDERERERRGSTHHQLPGPDNSRHKDASVRPKSRSRSRSPLRNGRLEHHSKSDCGSYEKLYEDRRPHSTSAITAAPRSKDDRRTDDLSSLSQHLAEREKLERIQREKLEKDRFERDRLERDRIERERIEKEKLLQSAAVAEREKLLQVMEQREKFLQTSGYLGLSPFSTGLPTHPALLDRRMALMGPAMGGYPFLERAPVPAAMWNPYDKSAADVFHRVEVERERERIAVMSRLSSIPNHLAVLEQERLREQILREQQEREYELRKQYLDRLPAFTAERLRAADPLALGGYFPRTVSPMFAPGGLASLKSNSPHGVSGVPPPLIPSSSSTAAAAAAMLSARSHDNSPSSSSKSKGCSPADSTSDLKDKREGSSTDPDAHSR